MTLSKKQIGALVTAFTLVAGGVGGWLHSGNEKNTPTRTTSESKIAAGSPTPLPATIIKAVGDSVFQVRAHVWVSQYMYTTVCIGDVKYSADSKPLCNEQAQTTDKNISVGETISLFNVKSLGNHVANENITLPTTRPRQDLVKGPVAAQVVHMVDGDTIQIAAQIWPGHYVLTDIRVGGIDTPEKEGKAKCAAEAKLAEKASAEAKRLVDGKAVQLTNIKFEKYGGRVLADVTTLDGQSLAGNQISKGLARPYEGKTKESWCHR